MADYQGSTTVSAPADSLFAYLADVENLPGYFARIRDARRTGGDEVHTKATLPDGRDVEGDAWFRVDDSRQHISWGSEDDANDYNGYLDVSPDGDGSRVEVHIHSPHADSPQVQQGIDETLATIKQQVEGAGAAS